MTDKKIDACDLTARQDPSWAKWLPALSGFYVHQLCKMEDDPDFYGPIDERLNPARYNHGWKGFDFYNGTDRNDSYYNYDHALYSAGHAKLDMDKSRAQERMVQNRRPGTFLLGDSGGFQIAKGTGSFKNMDWTDFRGPGGDVLRGKVLNWLEETADFSMTLDIPAFSAEAPLSAKTGLTSFQDTLDLSLLNLDYFMKNRTPGKTKFLNVLSGTSNSNSSTWYESVKHFSNPETVQEFGYSKDRTLEGYAFAGINMKHMPSVLCRMNDLIRDDLLKGKEWIHFLGIGRLDWACHLTAIQRQIREHYEPRITISFDAASAFLAVAKGQCYVNSSFTSKRFGYNMKKAVDDRNLKGSNIPMPFGGPIADRMTIGDICRYAPGEENKQGKVTNTSWDVASYTILMGHNVFTHLESIQEALRLFDFERAQKTVSYKDWSPKKRSVADDVSFYMPGSVLYFDDFVKVFFDPKLTHDQRKTLIENNMQFLESVSFGGQKANVFGDLFDTAGVNDNTDDDNDKFASYADIDDNLEDLI